MNSLDGRGQISGIINLSFVDGFIFCSASPQPLSKGKGLLNVFSIHIISKHCHHFTGGFLVSLSLTQILFQSTGQISLLKITD